MIRLQRSTNRDIKETPVLTASFGIQFLLMLGAPVAVGFWLKRRLGLPWSLFLGGALAFVLAWVVTNFLPLPGELGLLLTSITQMGALYLIYRFQLKTVHTEREAFMVGAGQAGVELILLAIIFVALPLMQMSPLRDATDEEIISLAARTDGVTEEEVEPERIDELREIIDDYWNTPWYGPLVQSVQSLSFLPIQIALAVIVLGAWMQNHWRSLIGAMALHFLSRIVPIYGGLFGGPIVWLALSLLFCGIACWFLGRLWPVIKDQAQAAFKAHRKSEKRA